ncbi:MAG TPA: carboxymuconolactone decarboxylase family protein [Planctomycetes bacterium]|nr:carboxymuconolactone decarboxylase family protein [Planctomycetota bacterium]
MKGFGQLHGAAMKGGTLSLATKELIALAIAVSGRCQGCITFHTYSALKAGAKREEILDALGVAILMGGGPSMVYALEAHSALEQFEGEFKD